MSEKEFNPNEKYLMASSWITGFAAISVIGLVDGGTISHFFDAAKAEALQNKQADLDKQNAKESLLEQSQTALDRILHNCVIATDIKTGALLHSIYDGYELVNEDGRLIPAGEIVCARDGSTGMIAHTIDGRMLLTDIAKVNLSQLAEYKKAYQTYIQEPQINADQN